MAKSQVGFEVLTHRPGGNTLAVTGHGPAGHESCAGSGWGSPDLPSGNLQFAIENGHRNSGSFHSYATVYQRVDEFGAGEITGTTVGATKTFNFADQVRPARHGNSETEFQKSYGKGLENQKRICS